MNRSKPLKRSGGSRPARGATPKKKVSMAEFRAKVLEAGACAICGNSDWWVLKQPHHFIERGRLERHGASEAALTDERNGVCLCASPCHERVTNARIECPRPPLLDEFLDDWNLLESGRPDPRRKDAA